MSYPAPPAIPRKLPGSGKAGRLQGGAYVIIQAWREQLAVAALLGPDGDQPGPTAAKWEVIDRPPRTTGYNQPGSAPITWFQGRENKTKTLQIILDGYTPRTVVRWSRPRRGNIGGWIQGPPSVRRRVVRRRGPVEQQIRILEEIADRGLTVRLIGPVRHTDRRWAIKEIAFGDYINDQAGRAVRQQLTLSLVEFASATGIGRLR